MNHHGVFNADYDPRKCPVCTVSFDHPAFKERDTCPSCEELVRCLRWASPATLWRAMRRARVRARFVAYAVKQAPAMFRKGDT